MVLKGASSIGSRNAETRERLIDAAIECLSEVGYSGTTMRRVAEYAGVTQGPRQYYFPTPALLFEAVVEKIHTTSDFHRNRTLEAVAAGSLEEKIRAIAEPAFENCGSPTHLAMIELKLACRGDVTLRSALESKILDYESRNDQIWIEMLASSGLPPDELKHMRNAFGATLRGFGVAIAAGADRNERLAIGETLIAMALARFSEAAKA